MNFVEAIKDEKTQTFTENGAKARNTSGDKCLDLFSTIGSLRGRTAGQIIDLFNKAWREDNLTALRILFYGRDVRGGLGERDTFRIILHSLAIDHPDIIKNNLWAIPYYGRWDDCYALIDTHCEDHMWKFMRNCLLMDIECMQKNEPCSLLAKWIRTGNESSKKSRSLGIKTAFKLGFDVYHFKRTIVALRKYIDIVEAKMSTNRWNEINYSAVPSRASMIYRNAFMRHDGIRYENYIESVSNGEAKINTNTLYPYDIVGKVWQNLRNHGGEDNALQAMWDNLPDYVGSSANALVIADTSGSMLCENGRPFYSAIALAIYFAQRNHGAFHNLWMTFSESPKYQEIEGDTLVEIMNHLDTTGWSMNTNLDAALKKILQTGIQCKVHPDDMPKSLIIISDMEIDSCEHSGWSFYDYMRDEFAKAGYEIPNIVFWNVNSRHDVFHADKSRKGVQLVSGQSASTFKQLMGSVGMTPMEFMMSILNSDRYRIIEL